jgi:hypothetical protein
MAEARDLKPEARPAGFRLPLGRGGLILAAMATIGAGMALNWGWLTAVGLAPLILAVAPCAFICGLGLCMMGGSKSCASKSDPAAAPDGTRD